MIDIKKIFGLNLRKLRKINNITQEEFAESVGMATQTINIIENGRQFPKIENFEKICEVYKISPSQLLIIPDEMKKSADIKLVNKIVSQLENLNSKELETIYRLIKAYKK